MGAHGGAHRISTIAPLRAGQEVDILTISAPQKKTVEARVISDLEASSRAAAAAALAGKDAPEGEGEGKGNSNRMVMGAATGLSGKRGKATVVDLLMPAPILAFTLVLTAELMRVLMLKPIRMLMLLRTRIRQFLM